MLNNILYVDDSNAHANKIKLLIEPFQLHVSCHIGGLNYPYCKIYSYGIDIINYKNNFSFVKALRPDGDIPPITYLLNDKVIPLKIGEEIHVYLESIVEEKNRIFKEIDNLSDIIKEQKQ